ncbi:hypothetical protein HYS72_00570 [Candidatus Pacearchaeota archaeon]|nr:hypothetical protein [Candidatus Pacearchaeota archaeon]
METDEYINYLKKLNGECECKDLSSLFFLNKKRKTLKNECKYLIDELNEDLNSEIKKIYDEVASSLMKYKNLYYAELDQLTKENKLKFYYHSERENYKKYSISSKEARELLKYKEIITSHCSNCEQQISLLN